MNEKECFFHQPRKKEEKIREFLRTNAKGLKNIFAKEKM